MFALTYKGLNMRNTGVVNFEKLVIFNTDIKKMVFSGNQKKELQSMPQCFQKLSCHLW